MSETKTITLPNGHVIQESVWHIGNQDFFETETDDSDFAQSQINYYMRLGYDACCLHEYGVHQLYVSKEKRKR